MNILAIDTSTTACVLGIRTEDTEITRFELIDRSHSLELLPRIVTILADANLDKNDIHLIVFGKGPGSFTGLRIAVGVTQGLAFGLDIPVVGVSTLACIA
ncbi:tRNA (adenosine(37)-N6)-threonylcarbamoyltransferase complex dimerization subunit type 1 TsaB, partial [Pseudomonadales bacterium]|nr:tRNA (adenosine(37)-N6)-threonylcarbamoyltransferase complex dimerization subunit type 1 TsaB [Pseudomonadales bacterium]